MLGSLNNCASGITPWDTYRSCEENSINYLKGPDQPSAHQARWGRRKGEPAGYRRAEHDERFDAAKHPSEPTRFGWVVEIDPLNPSSPPVKRPALGRAAHEGATVALTPDGRTMFINIQHPGESPSERSDPADPRRLSDWPDAKPSGRPRSATVVFRKIDGGVIGS